MLKLSSPVTESNLNVCRTEMKRISKAMEKKEKVKTASPGPSCVSMRSTNSMFSPPELSVDTMTSDLSENEPIQVQSKCGVCKEVLRDPVSITRGHRFCRPCISHYWDHSSHSGDFGCPRHRRPKTRPVLYTRGDIGASRSAQCCIEPAGDLQQGPCRPVDDVLQRVKDQHKTSMRDKYGSLFEGIKRQENQTPLNRIYTPLYIIKGESKGVNDEHEVLQMEKSYKTRHISPVNCNDVFKPLPETDCERNEKIMTVLTKGIAGIGKTVSVQKFILDWAEGTANQDVDFIFVLPFRELNLVRDDRYSLHRLLLDFHPELQEQASKIYDECNVVFIFDGLDESRITAMFADSEKVSDVTETSSLSVLMSCLINGDLLPSALIWITSRPAAANQIPSKYIDRVTEIQGFNDPQKKEYFRKRIGDQRVFIRIMSHIRRARSLHIICHIPVFCWISSTVLQKILTQEQGEESPKTLTEMYIHFLLIQINRRNQKYGEKDVRDPEEGLQSNREVIVKLSELAYQQLMKGNVMFYEEDLRECGIDITDASVYSGMCTEIFKEESVIYERKLYCFIHLSFQGFLAAFYVFYCFAKRTSEALKVFDLLANLHKGVIDAALQSENGHLDLFLRFLLGISLESNQNLLKGVLTHTENSAESIQKSTAYIKDKIKNEHVFPAGRSVNLYLCLLELNDQSLSTEIVEFLKSEKHSENKLSASHCSTIAYMLQVLENVLEELDLMKYDTSQEGRLRLLPAVTNCRKALLAGCDLNAQCCEIVASALQPSDSPLRELDLSINDLKDSGVKIISDVLKSPKCRLEILRLSGCMVTEEGCCYLASALSSNPSHMIELDLSYNPPGPSGVQLLLDRLHDPNCTLNKLNLDHAGSSRMILGLQKYNVHLTLDPNTANTRLVLCEEKRTVMCIDGEQSYPDHPHRFDQFEQVMCKERLSGRCYWETEWTGGACIAVTYKGIKKKGGSDCKFGWNDKSWSLLGTVDRFQAWHNTRSTDIDVQSAQINRVGVYLDEPAGILSYYSFSDSHTLAHLHTFHTTFLEPLYAGLSVYASMSLSC